jgi:hypothetical protein
MRKGEIEKMKLKSSGKEDEIKGFGINYEFQQ